MAADGSKAERETEDYYSPATSSFVCSLMALRCSNRHSRVCVGNILDYLGNTITKHETNSQQSFLLSGSNGEGVVVSNDIDYMLVDGQIEVSAEYHRTTSNSLKHCVTTLCSKRTHAGYATLVVNNPDVFPHKECIDIIGGKPCLASALYVQKALKQVTDVSDAEGYHGPAVIRARASELHVPSDYVYTLRCTAWPARTRERFQEQTDKKWPPEHLLLQLEQIGCHYVPTGYPGSPNKDAEWRLSFSCAEKVLVKNLNPTQYYCFNFLKMMARAGYLRSNAEPKVLCTYYFKTALFWTIEKEPGDVWVESRFLTCLHLILGRLVSFMRNHNLPNYFIPENNMIDHIPYERCSKVSEELESIRNELLYRVFSIVTLGVPLKEECRVFGEILPLGDREPDFANEKDREKFNKNLVDTLSSRDSTEQDELMQRATSVISNESEIFRDKRRKDVRNDLQNFLDPQLFDFLPGLHESQVLKQALLSAIEHIASLTERPNYAACYEKILYRTLGNICHVQSLVPSTAGSEAKAKLNEEAELYYCKGKSLVFPDGFDDQTLSGHVLLAQFHYMNGESAKTAEEIKKIESIIDDEKLARRISEYCVCTEICNPLHLEVLLHDQRLYDYFQQLPPRASKFINSVVLAHFLRIRTLAKEVGQTEDDRVNTFRRFCESFRQQRSFSLLDEIVNESTDVLLQILDEKI